MFLLSFYGNQIIAKPPFGKNVNMKLDRMLGIINILLQKEKVTAPYLADKFEVSRRTINRDIEDICKAGIPLVTMQGINGGISFEEGYKINKNFLTYEELESIIIGLKGLESVSDSSYTNRLLDKLFTNRDDSSSLKDNIVIDLSSHYKSSLTEKIDILKESIRNKNKVSFYYYNSKGELEREAEPYYIAYKWTSWYLFAYCMIREDFRIFKLNRMHDLKKTDKIFLPREIPEERNDFDQYFSDEINITLLLDESLKYRLIDEYGLHSFQTMDDGKLKFQTSFTDKQYMLSWILSYSDKVEVLEPLSIRDEIKQIAENIINIYKKT